LTFLNCLEHSENYPALEVLDPTRHRQPSEPTDRPIQKKLKKKPTPSTETIKYYIPTSDVAGILLCNTNLRDNWKVLRAILEINSEVWTKIPSDPAFTREYHITFFNTIRLLLQEWSRSQGFLHATVGVLYGECKEHGHDGIIGKLRKPSVMSGESY
jgi:hypothetical protein